MSSKDKRKSILYNPFGFGSSALSSSSSKNKSALVNGKHRTIVLPKDNDIISAKDIPEPKAISKSANGNIPGLPQNRNQSRVIPQEKKQHPHVQPQQLPSISVESSSAKPSPRLDPVKSLQSDLTLQRSNSPGVSLRRTLIRKPPPPIISKAVTQSPAPVEIQEEKVPVATPKDVQEKPDLNKLITSIEGDVSDFNPSSAAGVSPLPSSVYSPYSPLTATNKNNLRSNSNFNLIPQAQESTSGTVVGRQNSPAGNFDDEIKKIEDLLSQSTILNKKVDHHLTHSRHASLDPKAPHQESSIHGSNVSIDKDFDSGSEFEHEDDDQDMVYPRWTPNKTTRQLISKDSAMTNLSSIVKNESGSTEQEIVRDFSLIGSPSNIRQQNYGSELQTEPTTDDEFYDAENGEQKPISRKISSAEEYEQEQSEQEQSEQEESEEQQSLHRFKVVNRTPSVSSSPSYDDQRVNSRIADMSIDLSSADPTPDPYETIPARTLNNKFSMDAINGHGSEMSLERNGPESEVDYEGRAYDNGDNDDLHTRYIDQQEDFYNNQQNLSPYSYSNSSPIHNGEQSLSDDYSSSLKPPSVQISADTRSSDQNVSSRFQESSSSETGDQASDEEELRFTARSPFYSPFEYSEDSQPRRMIITNNVSEPDSESESDSKAVKQDTDLKHVVNKRDSYFGDLDINDYIDKENERLLQQQQSNTLQIPDQPIATGKQSPPVSISEGLSNMYDRREEATVVPVSYSDRTSSAAYPATSPGATHPHLASLSTSAASLKKKPPRRRPPPEFPVSGRTGRSLSVNQEQLPVFVENTSIIAEGQPSVIKQLESLAVPKSESVSSEPRGLHPGQGEKSAYVMMMRRTAGTSYSMVGPPKWPLPVAIRAQSDKVINGRNRMQLSTKYSKTTMSLFKKGVLSSADIKHGNLKPRLLASEVDDEEIEKANLAAAQASSSTPTTSSSLAHTQLGSMIPPGRTSNELQLVHSKNNSVYSGTSSNSQHRRPYSMNDELDFDDYMQEDYRAAQYLASPKLDDISELNRSTSVKSYLPGASGTGKMRLFIANPDNDDSD